MKKKLAIGTIGSALVGTIALVPGGLGYVWSRRSRRARALFNARMKAGRGFLFHQHPDEITALHAHYAPTTNQRQAAHNMQQADPLHSRSITQILPS